MSVFKTSICSFVFRLLFFPMISPWYVPLSSQPRPYHRSNTGKHGGKKLACEKCIFMKYCPGDFTCVVLAFVVHSPRCLQASKRGACTMENKVLQRSGSMLCPPKYPVVATSAQKVSAFILLDFFAPWTVCLYQAKTSAKHGGVMRTKTRCTSEASLIPTQVDAKSDLRGVHVPKIS